MKDYQDFMENSQKYLIKEFKTTLSDFMNNIKEQFYETNQRITDESELSNRRLIATEQNLLRLINNNNEEIKSKSDKSSSKINRLKRELRRNKKEHQTILDEIAQDLSEFRDEFDDAKSKQVKINQNVDQDLLKIKEYNAEFKEKIDTLFEECDKKFTTNKSRIKKLSKKTKNLSEQQIEVKENLSSISKLFIFK